MAAASKFIPVLIIAFKRSGEGLTLLQGLRSQIEAWTCVAAVSKLFGNLSWYMIQTGPRVAAGLMAQLMHR